MVSLSSVSKLSHSSSLFSAMECAMMMCCLYGFTLICIKVIPLIFTIFSNGICYEDLLSNRTFSLRRMRIKHNIFSESANFLLDISEFYLFTRCYQVFDNVFFFKSWTDHFRITSNRVITKFSLLRDHYNRVRLYNNYSMLKSIKI